LKQCSNVYTQQRTRHRASTSTRRHFAFALCSHSIDTRAPIANLPNSAQLGGTPYHSPKLHPGPYSSVGMWRRTDTYTQRHTDVRDQYTFRVVYNSREMQIYERFFLLDKSIPCVKNI